jgi:acyl carrier protein
LAVLIFGDEMSVNKKIRNYVLENYLFTDDQSALNDDDSFMGLGIIDSTGILEIISFLEEEFDLQVKDEEILPENLDSVNNIVTYMERKNISD